MLQNNFRMSKRSAKRENHRDSFTTKDKTTSVVGNS